MSPERQIFEEIEKALYNWDTQKDDLRERAIKAFYEDHPEVRQLFIIPFHDGSIRLEVNLYGESAAYKYYHEELPEAEHSKLKKCLKIMEDLFKRMDA